MHPTPSVIPLATSTATTKPASFLERHVGELVAGAAGTIALALPEFQDRGLTRATKMAGGEAIAQLFKPRQFMMGTWEFRHHRPDARPSGAA